MKCLACGAEMRLMQVGQRGDPASAVAFERHTFKCSACPQISQRLVFSRPRSPISDLKVARPPKSADLQMGRISGANALAKMAENLRSKRRRIAIEARGAAPIVSRSEGFEKHQSRDTPVQERQDQSPKARRTSTWEEVVQKGRTRQIALQDRAGALSPPTASNPHASETHSADLDT